MNIYIYGHFSGEDDSYDDEPRLKASDFGAISTDVQAPKCPNASLPQEMEHVWVDDPSLSVRAWGPQKSWKNVDMFVDIYSIMVNGHF